MSRNDCPKGLGLYGDGLIAVSEAREGGLEMTAPKGWGYTNRLIEQKKIRGWKSRNDCPKGLGLYITIDFNPGKCILSRNDCPKGLGLYATSKGLSCRARKRSRNDCPKGLGLYRILNPEDLPYRVSK